MQTFDVSLPASHIPSTCHSENSPVSEKPKKSGEQFGAVMDRALSEAAPEQNIDDPDAPTTDQPTTP
jgi:hypothetical protein